MSQSVSGFGPVAFLSADGARMISLPLASLYFDAAGDIQVHDGWVSTADKPVLLAWLKRLVQRQMLAPGKKPAPEPAMKLTAAKGGLQGNRTSVVVAAAGADTVDITVTMTDVYEAIQLADLDTVLDASGGLLRVQDIPAAAGDVQPGDVPANGDPPTWSVGDYVLKLRRSTQANLVTVTLGNVSGLQEDAIFTLVAEWKKTVSGVDLAGMAGLAAEFNYAVKITAPDGDYKLPRPGTVNLSGGRAPTEPLPAGATLFAGD